MKKIISFILAMMMLLSVTAYAADTDRVEISFKVGDSTLTINGKAVTVEKPYIVGEGTTLVPLRVITEAFGATVEWVQETKEIYLTYPDVKIKMQIGNTSVTVNDHTETLPAAPELTQDVTMVPLRFISETFGAEVGYNNDTKAITVVKQQAAASQTVQGITSKERIGDSYYGWSIETPAGIPMEERTFDGTYTEFIDEEGNCLFIEIVVEEEAPDFEKLFADLQKGIYDGVTLQVADKLKDSQGNRYIHFAGKSKEVYREDYVYIKGNNVYAASILTDIEGTATDKFKSILKTFSLTFNKDITHDLSDLDEQNNRTFTDELCGITAKIPVGWYDYSGGSDSEFEFIHDKTSDRIHIGIYSLSSTANAKYLAERDRNNNSSYLNSKSTVSIVQPYKVNNSINGVYYTIITSGTANNDRTLTDIFFDYGDYTYNITFDQKKKDNDFIQRFLSNLELKPIDKYKAGMFLRGDTTTERRDYVSKSSRWSTTLSSEWQEAEIGDTYGTYMHTATGSVLSFVIQDATGLYGTAVGDYVNYEYSERLKDITYRSIQSVAQKRIGNATFYTYTIYSNSGNLPMYVTVYTGIKDGSLMQFVYIRNDVVFDGPLDNSIDKIIENLKFN